jgi:hypothetical protein
MDKAELFKPRDETTESGFPEEDVTILIGGVEHVVRIRGLSRIEGMYVQMTDDPQVQERRAMAAGLIDPKLTEHEVGDWQRVALAGEMNPVAERITIISGMAEGSAKQAVKDFVDAPETEFRVLPSDETRDDGIAPTPGDE